MIRCPFFILLMLVAQNNGQIDFYSDIQLIGSATQFQPANPIELLNTLFTITLVDCGQLCNQNVQCRTYDYDSYSLMCRLYEGAIETGAVIPSGSPTSRVGAVLYQSNLFAAFGQQCAQCTQSRYLICSADNNNTCQCPNNTIWNGSQCKNQGYEDANCSNNQWCRGDVGITCSKLNFCTEYRCNNMTIIKADLPGNDLTSSVTPNFSMCCSWCQSYPSCTAFTWISIPGIYFGNCYLKYSFNGNGSPNDGHISAYY